MPMTQQEMIAIKDYITTQSLHIIAGVGFQNYAGNKSTCARVKHHLSIRKTV